MELLDFKLNNGHYSSSFRVIGIHTFLEACNYIKMLPYGRNSNNSDLDLVLIERKGSCSSKHALLARLAEENNVDEIELIAGVFLMDEIIHPKLKEFFNSKIYSSIPEMHCYLRYGGKRFDFTSKVDNIKLIEAKLVREQIIEPQQAGDWKKSIHQDYLRKWLLRKPELKITLDELWEDREKCIELLS